MSRTRTIAAVLAALLVACPALAHQFWIRPGRFMTEPDAPLRVMLFHGERFEGGVVHRDDAMIERFECVEPEGVSPVKGLSGQSTSYARPSAPGDHILVYRAGPYSNVLDAEAFHAYLVHEGLDEVIERRESLGERDDPGREVYSRCAKSLVRAGGGDAPPRDREVGLPLEIVLLDAAPDGPIRARLLFRGRPLSGAKVVAVLEGDPASQRSARADQSGVVSFEAGVEGVWLLASVHMVRLEGHGDADWESFWASLTFETTPG